MTGTIEFYFNLDGYKTSGVLKKVGNNRFLTLSQCTNEKCVYYMYVNNDLAYKSK